MRRVLPLFAALGLAFAPVPPPRPALPHEGKAVNGLRLEVAATFVPEKEGWGAPKLKTSFTFHNETDREIVLDGHSIAFRLIPSRLSPSGMVQVTTARAKPWCPLAPQPGHLIRIPARRRHVIARWQWCDTLEIPFGKSQGGKVRDVDTVQLFRLKQAGQLTLAFLYRSDGAHSDSAELEALLNEPAGRGRPGGPVTRRSMFPAGRPGSPRRPFVRWRFAPDALRL